jgi:hypothetical protein
MKLFKLLVVSCLLVMALAIAGSAQTQVTQLPATCVAGTLYNLSLTGTAYESAPGPGLFVCLAGNTFGIYYGAGSTVQGQIGADFTNLTATPATVLSFPVLASTNYRFACLIFYGNSGTNAVTFTLTTPASPTNVFAESENIYAAAGTQAVAPLSGSPLAIATTAAATGTNYIEKISGIIENGATTGTLALQASSATGTTTVKRGSFCAVNSLP